MGAAEQLRLFTGIDAEVGIDPGLHRKRAQQFGAERVDREHACPVHLLQGRQRAFGDLFVLQFQLIVQPRERTGRRLCRVGVPFSGRCGAQLFESLGDAEAQLRGGLFGERDGGEPFQLAVPAADEVQHAFDEQAGLTGPGPGQHDDVAVEHGRRGRASPVIGERAHRLALAFSSVCFLDFDFLLRSLKSARSAACSSRSNVGGCRCRQESS